MDCRSAVLTDEALAFTIPDKVGWVKRGHCGMRGD
jgi:hypothetical protein